jgi:perosamine synthetase
MSIPAPDPGGQRIAANWRKRPARDRRSCLSAGRLILPSLSDIAGRAHTSSGCAALLAAFGQMDLALGSHVLVPSDHCPKMIGPVMQAGLVPVIYSIGPDGLPKLQDIAPTDLTNTGAIIAAQRLGLPRSLQTAQEQSRVRHIQVIEDCAHGYFGWAGNRPVGHWSDFAIGSLTKHLPVGQGCRHRHTIP